MYRVYRNLNNGLISIKDKKTNRVIGYAEEVWIDNPKFIVSEAGRQRVLREQRKSVHAFIEGSILKTVGFVSRNGGNIRDNVLFEPDDTHCTYVSYNPYKYDWFYDVTRLNNQGVYSNVWGGRLAYVNSEGVIKVW